MRKYKVTLERGERDGLDAITRKGSHKSQKVINALILLNCDEGEFQSERMKNEDVAAVLKISMRKIDRVRKGERVYKRKADGDFEAHLVALSCSEPPKGYSRWSLRLLADQVVELDYIESISYETVRRVLKKTKSSLGERKDG